MQIKGDADAQRHRTVTMTGSGSSSGGKTPQELRREDKNKVNKVRKLLHLPERAKKVLKIGGVVISGNVKLKKR